VSRSRHSRHCHSQTHVTVTHTHVAVTPEQTHAGKAAKRSLPRCIPVCGSGGMALFRNPGCVFVCLGGLSVPAAVCVCVFVCVCVCVCVREREREREMECMRAVDRSCECVGMPLVMYVACVAGPVLPHRSSDAVAAAFHTQIAGARVGGVAVRVVHRVGSQRDGAAAMPRRHVFRPPSHLRAVRRCVSHRRCDSDVDMHACVRVCVYACVRVCVCACVRVCR
jgi:hypothetical protein